MTDTELRELCQRFFDAVERRDLDAVAEIYAPEFRFWVNLTGAESSARGEPRDAARRHALHRRRTYDDRTIDTFATASSCSTR